MTTIDFGIFDHIEINSGRTAGQLYEERIQLIRRGEELGMYGYHLAGTMGKCCRPVRRLPFCSLR